MVPRMKAARVHAYGASSEIRIEQTPMPDLQANEVLIRVVATSVNPVDWKIRKGYLKTMIPYEMPLIMGWDVSGVVDKTGPAVTRFVPGDAVCSRPDIARNGAYAEYIAVREAEVAFKPATISHVEAASLPLVSITAWEWLFITAHLTQGQRVLIHAGAGGVGSIAVQLAHARGAHVTATASAGTAALVRSLGADDVIDYHFRISARSPATWTWSLSPSVATCRKNRGPPSNLAECWCRSMASRQRIAQKPKANAQAMSLSAPTRQS